MARLRTIKPSFFTHEVLAELSPLHRLLFQGLWCYADREGRLEDRPKFLKTVILPYDDCDIDLMLYDLAERGFVVRYEIDGRKLISLPGFARHQKPHLRELPSELPAPEAKQPKPRKKTKTGPSTTQAVLEHNPGDAEPGGLGDMDNGLGDYVGKSTQVDQPPQEISLKEIWNECADPSLQRWEAMGEDRKKPHKARIAEHPDPEYWRKVIAKINATPFCLGENKDGWRANPDFLLRPGSAEKILEGKYDRAKKGGTVSQIKPEGPTWKHYG